MIKRKLLAGLLIGTMMVSMTACGKDQPAETETANETQTEAAPVSEETEESDQEAEVDPYAEKMASLETEIQEYIDSNYQAGGTVSVCVKMADSDATAAIDSHPMQSASLMKLYVAGAVYENKDSLENVDIESLMSSMITVSDNDSCNTLVKALGNGDAEAGFDKVNAYCEEHGFTDTHMGRLMLAPNDQDDNYTSVTDCTNFLQMLLDNSIDGSEEILGYMKQQTRTTKIPAGIPSGVETANKTGELSDVENDAAIIFADKGTYIMVCMSEDLTSAGSAQDFITGLAGEVYQFLQK